jgi:hypothetical protein
LGFRPVFSTLGVEFDLRGASQGVLRVGNTEMRKVELKSMVEKHLAEGSVTPEESERLRSCVMFSRSSLAAARDLRSELLEALLCVAKVEAAYR